MLTFNHISREQMSRLDIIAFVHPDRVFSLEPNAFNAYRLLTQENPPSDDELSLVHWLMKSMSNHGVLSVWNKLTQSKCTARNDTIIRCNDTVAPIVVKAMSSFNKARGRYTPYKGPSLVLNAACVAMFNMVTNGEPINKGSSFEIKSWIDLENGACDATVVTATNKTKKVILFPDEVKTL